MKGYAVACGSSVPRKEPLPLCGSARRSAARGWLTSNNLSHARGRRILVTGKFHIVRTPEEALRAVLGEQHCDVHSTDG